jgi:NADH-quinone oxidoreductase subunit J
MNTIFYLTSIVAVIATFMVITRHNPVHALLYLIVSLLSVAVLFYLLGAIFVAALEVIIYAGAIMVLFVFVIMMLNISPHTDRSRRCWSFHAWMGPIILGVILLGEMIYILSQSGEPRIQPNVVSPKQLGMAIYGPYLLTVELASMLLMAGLIGAHHLGRKNQIQEKF